MASLGMTPDEFERYLDEPFFVKSAPDPMPDTMEVEEVSRKRAFDADFPALPAASRKRVPDALSTPGGVSPRQDMDHANRDGDSASDISSLSDPEVEEPSLPPLMSGDAPPSVPRVAVSPSGSVATPTGGETALPVASKPARRRGRRSRFVRLDYSKLEVPTPDDAKVTVLFRPVDKNHNLSLLHQGRLFKQLLETGTPVLVRDLRGGALAVDLPPGTDPGSFLSVNSLQDIAVKASLPASVVSRSGVIHGLHPEVQEQEFLEEVSSDAKVLGFARLARPGQQTWVAKLLFQGTVTPKSVRYAGRVYRVSEYRPRPVQCGNCFAYNHKKENCKKAPRCPDCGGPHSLPCEVDKTSCLNCGGAHSATHPDCSTRGFHAKVAQVRAVANMSAPAAKAAVHRAAKTYAAAAAKTPTRSPRPEASRNKIFINSPTASEKATSFVADVVAAVLAAAKEDNYAGLLPLLERILTEYTGTAVPDGALKGLIGTRTQGLRTQN